MISRLKAEAERRKPLTSKHRKAMLKLWAERYGYRSWVKDMYGSWMYVEDFGNPHIKRIRPGTTKQQYYGWDCDHITPKKHHGSNHKSNLELVNIRNNRIKNDQIEFAIHNIKASVKKRPCSEGYEIQDLETGRFVDWLSNHPNIKD